jgi:amidohydrolase
MSISCDEWGEVAACIDRLAPELIEFRHALHRDPEVGLQTPDTRAAVAAMLQRTSVRIRPPLLGTDLIAELPGATSRTICLRADMDALPIAEHTGLPYQSRREGRMHACGHDGHTAILVGAALALDRFRDRLPVTVRFIFQPGEEIVCGGRDLVERGACDNAEAAFALHGWRGLAAGCVATKSGAFFAAAGFFRIELTGKGCHGSQPEAGNNPIPCAAAIIRDLQDYHRRVSAAEKSVVTVCVVRAGDTSNVIPDTAVIEGTFRYLSTEAGDRLEAGIRAIIEGQAKAGGISTRIVCERPYSLPVINSPDAFERVRRTARAALPADAWREWPAPVMGAEDFAFYLAKCGGAMFFLGLGESSEPLHTERFDFNDAAVVPGVRMMSRLALDYDCAGA